jgi:hypothetical protein
MLTIKIINPEQQAIENALTYIVDSPEPSNDIASYTNGDGIVQFTNHSAIGNYTFNIHYQGVKYERTIYIKDFEKIYIISI